MSTAASPRESVVEQVACTTTGTRPRARGEAAEPCRSLAQRRSKQRNDHAFGKQCIFGYCFR